MTYATLSIEGMSCDHCVRAVRAALATLPGVTVESVGVGRADVRFDESRATAEQLAIAVGDAGYTATVADVRH
jgi:copper chaperone